MPLALSAAKIERGALSEKVVSILREAIAKGELVPGERLPEKFLSEQLGVSRAPIRDAFRILELEGLVQIIPQKGARIKGLTVKDVESIYELRSTLDSLAIRLAVPNLREEDFSYLGKLLQQMKGCIKKRDTNSYKNLNSEFHDFFYQKSQNQWLCDVNKGLMKHIMRLRSFSLARPKRLKESYEDHVNIFEALKREKNAEAEEIAKKHTKEAGNFVLQFFSKKENTLDSLVI
ncbi:MAG: GntR family transcriptional regulator [Thermodesulfobacteriota bacterium]|nr:GntR family transcriptional regulator [Thermodesulfobacteriota bacterium]